MNGSACTINLLPASGGALRERWWQPTACWDPAWTPDGSTLLFVSLVTERNRRSTVSLMSAFGGEPHPTNFTMEQIIQMRVKPDGRELLFTAGYPREEHWIMESFLDQKH